MLIDFKSAKITVYTRDTKDGTGISPDRKRGVLHLTRNASQMVAGGKTASDVDTSAINIHASVDLHLSPGDHLNPGDNISILKFRFIQLALHLQSYASWTGCT